jgi:hypothetical protein
VCCGVSDLQKDVWRRPLRVNYPSKIFTKKVRAALDARKVIEVEIASGWRGQMLAKEVEFWATTGASTKAGGGPAKSPSFIFNLCNIKLVAFHWFALSAQYEMQSVISGNEVVLKYIPR